MRSSNPANDKIVEYLRSRARPEAEAVSPPGNPHRDYLESGAHPDIVERLWKSLNDKLPEDSKKLVYGTPVLMNPGTGEILAVAIGTSYAVRLPPTLRENHPDGAASIIKWSGDKTMDLGELFGPGWVVGKWLPEELEWLLAADNS